MMHIEEKRHGIISIVSPHTVRNDHGMGQSKRVGPTCPDHPSNVETYDPVYVIRGLAPDGTIPTRYILS
jgi:hypothetical protein